MDKHIIQNANKFLNFLNRSPTPFHVVDSARRLLIDDGFRELKLNEQWVTVPNGKYFVTKNETTLIAFSIGGLYKIGNGFSIVGAHTDSPCLKVKLQSKRVKSGYLQLACECYGGGIWHTWFDRDLTVAGRVLLTNNQNNKVEQRLLHIKRPILKIPNLAIHLNRETNEKFSPNKETHLQPILATSVTEQLITGRTSTTLNPTANTTQREKHHPVLIDLICKELNCVEEDIYDLELYLCDAIPASLGGVFDEFIFGPRLDNQMGAYCSIQSLIESTNLEQDENIRIAAIYDHEECGSESATGAASALTEHVLRRLSSPESFELAVQKSFLISADQAHAIHPNYSECHEELHRPSLNGGVVLKYNGNQRYATNQVTAAVIRESGKLANVSVQDFMVKNDSPCGSTIGPILSAKLGISTVDIGMPQLSMHSIRETSSTKAVSDYVNLLQAFYSNYSLIKSKLSSLL